MFSRAVKWVEIWQEKKSVVTVIFSFVLYCFMEWKRGGFFGSQIRGVRYIFFQTICLSWGCPMRELSLQPISPVGCSHCALCLLMKNSLFKIFLLCHKHLHTMYVPPTWAVSYMCAHSKVKVNVMLCNAKDGCKLSGVALHSGSG